MMCMGVAHSLRVTRLNDETKKHGGVLWKDWPFFDVTLFAQLNETDRHCNLLQTSKFSHNDKCIHQLLTFHTTAICVIQAPEIRWNCDSEWLCSSIWTICKNSYILVWQAEGGWARLLLQIWERSLPGRPSCCFVWIWMCSRQVSVPALLLCSWYSRT